MKAKDFRNVLLFMCNKWNKGESNLIFNGSDFDPEKWKYSIGEHIWNKWLNNCENHHGPINCITNFSINGIIEAYANATNNTQQMNSYNFLMIINSVLLVLFMAVFSRIDISGLIPLKDIHIINKGQYYIS